MTATTDGFVRCPYWLIDDADLSAHELVVYLVLLRFRNPKTGKCFPGMTTIADRARLSRRTVMRAIEGLEEKEMIRVERRSSIKDNQPNVYHVALANEVPEGLLTSSVRGRRIPKRHSPSDSESLVRPGDSESPGLGGQASANDSESLASDSESPAPVTRSHPKKNKEKKNKQEAMRRQQPSAPINGFTFAVEEKVTEKQLSYLADLYIFITGRVPEARTRESWEALDTAEASKMIDAYWGQMPRGRGGMWESPVDETHIAFRALSALGKQWVVNGNLPNTLGEAA